MTAETPAATSRSSSSLPSPAGRPAPKLVGVLAARTVEELAARAAGDPARRCDLLELRYDLLDPLPPLDDALDAVRRGLGRHRTPLLFTCRPRWEGGGFAGDESDRLGLLRRAAGSGSVGFVDIELRAVERLGRTGSGAGEGEVLPALDRVVLSFHDFDGTPGDLEVVADRMAALRPAEVKIVTTAGTVGDMARVLALNGAAGVSAFAMGEIGFPSRILSVLRGASFVYAAVDPGAPSAPGQIDVATVLDRYRLRALGAATRVYGVSGYPVAQSPGPRLHNALFHRHRIDAVYLPFLTPDFHDLWSLRRTLGIAGLSVTLPHKETAARLVDEDTSGLGAVNTVWADRSDDGASSERWRGANTDALAVLEGLSAAAGGRERLRARLRDERVVMIGAGGAARAILLALVGLGARRGIVVNRSAARAEALARETGWEVVGLDALETMTPADLGVIVQATSVGMWPEVERTVVPRTMLGPGGLVLDVVHNPPETRLVREARAAGAVVMTGREMFLRQAAHQVRLFSAGAVSPELAEVEAALESAP